MPPPAPELVTGPWHCLAAGPRGAALRCSSVLGDCHEGFSMAGTAAANLSPESPRVTCHRAEAMLQPPQTASGVPTLPRAALSHRSN